jgi:hypothetical protein
MQYGETDTMLASLLCPDKCHVRDEATSQDRCGNYALPGPAYRMPQGT